MDLLHRLLGGDTITVKTIWEDPEKIVDRGAVHDRLSAIQSGRDLHRVLGELTYACQDGEVGKYGNAYIKDEEGIVELWNLYILCWRHFIGEDIPLVESVETFGSGRNCDWAVSEFGHPYLAFSVDKTFKYVLTDKGRAMQKALGTDIEITTWTYVSE